MILFARSQNANIYAIDFRGTLDESTKEKLQWLLTGEILNDTTLDGWFKGPRKEMLTPWSTNAVEITQNMGIEGIFRIEEFEAVADEKAAYDPMLSALYQGLDQEIFTIEVQPEPIVHIQDIAAFIRLFAIVSPGCNSSRQ